MIVRYESRTPSTKKTFLKGRRLFATVKRFFFFFLVLILLPSPQPVAADGVLQRGVQAAATNSVRVVLLGNVTVTDSLGVIVCGDLNTCSVTAEIGTEITLSLSVAPGWTFNGWDSTLCSGVELCTFAMPAPNPYQLQGLQVNAIAIPDSTSPDVMLSQLTFPPEVQSQKIRVLDISDDGRFLLYVVNSVIVRWRDLLTLEDIYIGDDIYGVPAMSSNGRFVVWSPNNEVYLWDSAVRIPTRLSEGNRASISADGRFVAIFSLLPNPNLVIDRQTGNSINIPNTGIPVIAPDGSTVAVLTNQGLYPGSSLNLFDPTTGLLQKSIPTNYDFLAQRISANGRFAFGWISGGPDDQLGHTRVDLLTGEIIRIPHSIDPYGCSNYRFATTALNDGSALFTTWSTAEMFPTGPIEGGLYDFYGMYQTTYSEGTATATSATGAVLPLPTPSNDCASVVATPDGQTYIFSSERSLPLSSQGAGTQTFLSGSINGEPLFGATALPTGTRVAAVQVASVGGHQISIVSLGNGSGTITSNPIGINCGTTCTATYETGSTVTLTATPGTSSIFTGWSGACTSTATTCTVPANQDRYVTATFTANAFALTVSKSGTGTGTVASELTGIKCGTTCTATYATGSTVTLTATAATRSRFTGWSGACTGTATTCTVSMNQARTVTATFQPVYALKVTRTGTGSGTVSSNPAGISCGMTCSQSFVSGTSVTLTATAAIGSRFIGWSGACTGTATTCTVSMTRARTTAAFFGQI